MIKLPESLTPTAGDPTGLSAIVGSTLSEHLRKTTETMARRARVSMAVWCEHSNACLSAAEEIDRLRTALEAIRDTAIAMKDSRRCYPKRETVITSDGPERIRQTACDALHPANNQNRQAEL
jgi:hypothetical protein